MFVVYVHGQTPEEMDLEHPPARFPGPGQQTPSKPSRRLQPALFQQRINVRAAAAEGFVGFFGVLAAAGGVDEVVEAGGGGGVEDVAGFLEGAEGVRVHHL